MFGFKADALKAGAEMGDQVLNIMRIQAQLKLIVSPMKNFSLAALGATSMFMAGLPVLAYDSQAHVNAAIVIFTSRTWWQMGQISRVKIMSFSQKSYRQHYGSDISINWNMAVKSRSSLIRLKIKDA